MWRVIFGNYYPREVMETFTTRTAAEAWAAIRQQRNGFMLNVEEYDENDTPDTQSGDRG